MPAYPLQLRWTLTCAKCGIRVASPDANRADAIRYFERHDWTVDDEGNALCVNDSPWEEDDE
jgi:hypothetical protein